MQTRKKRAREICPDNLNDISADRNASCLSKKAKNTTQPTPNSFRHDILPKAVEVSTMLPVTLPPDWGSKRSAQMAARKTRNLARLMGKVTISFANVSPDSFEKLFDQKPHGTPNEHGEFFDQRFTYQIPLSKVFLLLKQKKIITASSNSQDLLRSLADLQSPDSSAWGLPFLRVISEHDYDVAAETLEVVYHVYFERLIFELISNESVKTIADNLHRADSSDDTPIFTRPPCTDMFTKTDAEMLQLPAYRFSLAGLLKYVENTGYPMCVEDPPGLEVSLYDYQKSSYQWMMDQEHSPHGLNAHFWQEWKFSDGGPSLYYFPLGGEFRFDQPPVTTGGLLCEEMGLGKTIEVLAVIEGNPLGSSATSSCKSGSSGSNSGNDLTRVSSRATLIVVPAHLVHQWMEEIRSKLTRAGTGELKVLNMGLLKGDKRGIPLEDIRWVRESPSAVEADYENENESMWTVTRGEWGQFTLVEQLVEVRNLPGAPSGHIYRGVVTMKAWHEFWRSRREAAESGSSESSSLVLEVKVPFADEIHDHDIVVTTYANLKSFSSLYRSVHWHRIVLDECQEIKVATNQIATMCASLHATHRWMVSGTPLISNISDLHGELNFLRIWPFSLPDRVDGFWSLKIAEPYRHRSHNALVMLQSLLSAVMMRHTKSQRYISTQMPLVVLPSRTIEYKAFSMTDPNERYLYDFISSFAADALEDIRKMSGSLHLWQLGGQNARYGKLRSFLGIMSRCLTSASAIDLRQLDHLRRMLTVRHMQTLLAASSSVEVPLLPAEEILLRVQALGAGTMGGLNRATHRVQANVAQSEQEEELRKSLVQLTRPELMRRVQELELPAPMSWIKMNFLASSVAEPEVLLLHQQVEKDGSHSDSSSSAVPSAAPTTSTSANTGADASTAAAATSVEAEAAGGGGGGKKGKSLHHALMPGSTLRIGSATNEDVEVLVEFVHDRFADPSQASDETVRLLPTSLIHTYAPDDIGYLKTITPNAAVGGSARSVVYRHDFSSRKQPYIDLLVNQRRNAPSQHGGQGAGGGPHSLHEEGFSTLYKLMAGQAVACPLCLVEATRPTITTCVHAFCYDCIQSVLQREGLQQAKCPVCRRALDKNSLMEVKMDNVMGVDEADAAEEEEVSMCEKLQMELMEEGDDVDASEKHSSSSMAAAAANTTDVSQQPAHEWITGNTKFIVPEFDSFSSAPCTSDVERYRAPYLSSHITPRDMDLLSLPPTFLQVFHSRQNAMPARLQALLDDMSAVEKDDPFAKFVVFSQYKESLKAVETMLVRRGVGCCKIISQSSSPDIQNSLRDFHQKPESRVLLLTLGSSCSGLTLTVSHTCYLLEPTPSSADEAQAISRVHRIGQRHSVRCVVLYGKDTFEERLLGMRQRNQRLTELLASEKTEDVEAELERAGEREEDNSSAASSSRSRGKGKRRSRAQGQSALKDARKESSYFVGNNLSCLFGLTERRQEERQLHGDGM